MDSLFKAYSRTELTWRWKRRLPHWEQPGCTYFATFRTADSLPKSVLDFLELERNYWMLEHPLPWNCETRLEYSRKILEPLDRWLDKGLGACDLAKPQLSRIVRDSLRYFDGRRYSLDEYVIMPNHVHCLILPLSGVWLREIVKSWKSYSSRRINERKGIKGRFWMGESFDRIVRDQAELERYRNYIRQNPIRANLEGTRKYRYGCGVGIQ